MQYTAVHAFYALGAHSLPELASGGLTDEAGWLLLRPASWMLFWQRSRFFRVKGLVGESVAWK